MITLSDLLYALGGGLLLFVLCYLYRNKKNIHKQTFSEQLLDKNIPSIDISSEFNPSDTKTDPTLADLGFASQDPVLGKIDFTPSENVTRRRSISSHPADILCINVFAMPGHTFAGYELLQALLGANLRFGEMSIFHRYEEDMDKPKILFSVASATEPGMFDLNSMGSYSCSGLSLFMRIEKTKQPQKVFDLMLTTAKQLADDLSGEIYDGDHEPFSKASLARYQELLA